MKRSRSICHSVSNASNSRSASGNSRARISSRVTHRISWPSNAYGFALVYTTNIIQVGNSNIFQGPWIQEQPKMANPYLFTNPSTGPRRFYKLLSTQ